MPTKKKKTSEPKGEIEKKTDDIELMSFFQLEGLLATLTSEADENGEISEDRMMDLVKVRAELAERVREIPAAVLKLEAFADYLGREVDRIVAARRRVSRIAERLRGGVVKYMQSQEIEQITAGSYMLKVRACPEHVELDDDFHSLAFTKPKEIKNPSDEAVMAAREHGGIVVMQHDRRAIAEALKRGEKIPGARLERNYCLEIK